MGVARNAATTALTNAPITSPAPAPTNTDDVAHVDPGRQRVRVRLMEGYEEKTPHAPSYKVQQYLMTTASQSTATTPEPLHTQSRRPTL